MPVRPRSRQHYSVPVVESQPLTPESGLRVTLKQAIVGVVAVSLTASGYAYLVWNQSSQGTKIEKLTAKLETAAKVTTDKAQEDATSRVKIREDFMANQQKMTEVLGKLDTRLAVAENNQKAANDQLGKIVDLLQRPPAVPSRR